MVLSQDQLKAFYEVARLGGFTKAAEFLGLTQSALSHRIRNLETDLETALFVRAPTGIRLTEAGQKLLKYAQVQSQIEDEFIKEFKSPDRRQLKGAVRIAGVSTLMWSTVVPALGPLARNHTNIRLELKAREIGELPSLLQTGDVDLIVTSGKPNLHQYEEIYLGDEINVMVQSKKHATVPKVYLDHDPQDQTTLQYLKLQNSDLHAIERSYFDDINGILAGVEAGLGRAVLPLHLIQSRKNLSLVKGEKKLKQPVYLCYLKQPFYTRLQTEVIQLLQTEIPQRLNQS